MRALLGNGGSWSSVGSVPDLRASVPGLQALVPDLNLSVPELKVRLCPCIIRLCPLCPTAFLWNFYAFFVYVQWAERAAFAFVWPCLPFL